MTQLSRSAILGIAKESVLGTYVAPTSYIPFTKADFVDTYTYLRDESRPRERHRAAGPLPGPDGG